MNIDWSKAPSGAQFFNRANNCFYLISGNDVYIAGSQSPNEKWSLSSMFKPEELICDSVFIPRPDTMTPEEEAIKVEEWKAPHIEPDVEITATFSERLLKGETNNKYQVGIKGAVVDVYDILMAYGVTNPADQHAIKKMLMPGKRGHKDAIKDREEAIISLKRAIELEKGE